MRIVTFNVNGIRAAAKRGFAAWLASSDADVVALQEVRCRIPDLPLDVFGDYHVVYDPGELAGRNGVALLSRNPLLRAQSWTGTHFEWGPGGVPQPVTSRPDAQPRKLADFNAEGRWIQADVPDAPIRIASLYLPKGGLPIELIPAQARDGKIEVVSPRKYARKMEFMAGLKQKFAKLRSAARTDGRELLVVGDYNIAHTKLDLKNWRSNQKSDGFLPEERAWFDEILSPRTLVDVVRQLHPEIEGPYSWWSWRGQAFVNDAGWRIDYHLATPPLAKLATSATVARAADYEHRVSDHAAVVVDYDC